ncbi:MAG: DinB family protein [Pseudomonadota bacterium]
MNTTDAINDSCPWSGEPVSADSLIEYRGQTVGFCNPGCRDKFANATRYFDALIEPVAAQNPWQTLATYNRWYNQRLFDALAEVPSDIIWRDAGAFFGSVGATLNHIMVWDLTWLGRIQNDCPPLRSTAVLGDYPTPTSHTDILHDNLPSLAAARRSLDEVLIAFVDEVTPQQVNRVITYKTQDGTAHRKVLGGLLQHLFNHQTHHRGQVTALLHQQGVDYGVTDLLATLPDV